MMSLKLAPRRVLQLSIGFANVQGGSGMSRRSERVLIYGSYICRKWSSF